MERYAYGKGEPVNSLDPHGLSSDYPDYCDIYGDPNSPYGYDPICDNNHCPPGICDNSGGGGGGNGLPPCSQFASGMGWTGTQLFDFLTITKVASGLGLNLGGFSVDGPSGMQIAGGQGPSPGVPGNMTELVLTGNQAALTTLLNSMCQTSGYNASKPNCFAAAGFDLLHAGSPGNQINFRENRPTDSMQITGSFANGVWTLNIDIDPNNPMSLPLGALRHAGDVLRNSFTGRDTDYGRVAQDRGINPYQNNGYCRP